MENWHLWLGIAGLLITIIGATIKITRFISKENDILKTLLYNKFNEAKEDIDNETNNLRHEFGETLKSLRTHVEAYEQKLYQVELYIRDNYIEVPTFSEVIKEIKADIKALSIKLDTLLARPIKSSHN